MSRIVLPYYKISGAILKYLYILLLPFAISASGNINLPDGQEASRQLSNSAITVTPDSIICRTDSDGKYVPLALSVGQVISQEWPELIVSSLIISASMKSGGEKTVITFNNAKLTITQNSPDDSLHCFNVEKIGKKVETIPTAGAILPVNETAEKLEAVGAKIINLSPDFGFIVYLEMPSSEIQSFIEKTDRILKILLPNWQVGARQSIASIAANCDKKSVKFPYNGTWINIFSNTFSFSGGTSKFMIGIIPIIN